MWGLEIEEGTVISNASFLSQTGALDYFYFFVCIKSHNIPSIEWRSQG